MVWYFSSLFVWDNAGQLAPWSFKPLLQRDSNSIGSKAYGAVLWLNFFAESVPIRSEVRHLVKIYLLVQFEPVYNPLLIGYFDVAEVLFKLYIDHVLSESTRKLVRVNVDFDDCLFVSPWELWYFFRIFNCRRHNTLRSLFHTIGLDQDRVTSINLSIFSEVLGSLGGEVFGGVGVVILQNAGQLVIQK